MSHPAPTITAAASQQLASPLFGLPAEIRERLYSYYLAFTPADFAAGETMRPTHTYLDDADADVDEGVPATRRHSRPLPELMLSCRRAYAELAPLVHETAAVRVRRGNEEQERRVGVAFHSVLRLRRLRRLVLVVEMEHVNWNAWVVFFVGLVERAPGLEHLVVDWAPWDADLGAKKDGWRRRQYENKENEFFNALGGLAELKTVALYGRRVPQGWRERIEKNTRARVVVFPNRWWSQSWDEEYLGIS